MPTLLLSLATLAACLFPVSPLFQAANSGGETSTDAVPAPHQTAQASLGPLKYFGFSGIDCALDDPHDGVVKFNYVDEVAGFCNIAHMCAFSPNHPLALQLSYMNANGMKAVLAVQEILFETVGAGGTTRLALRQDYQQRWAQFMSLNGNVITPQSVQSLYLVDEPFWNGLTYPELELAANEVQASYPDIPILLVEAFLAIDSLIIPAAVDWIGFDHYGVLDPRIDPAYQREHQVLKSKISGSQKIVVIMESQWFPFYGWLGISQSDMKYIAINYFALAATDPDVIALIGYIWPGGLDDPSQLGARSLPPDVQLVYQLMGRFISSR